MVVAVSSRGVSSENFNALPEEELCQSPEQNDLSRIVNSRLSPISGSQSQLLRPGITKYYVGGTISRIETTAAVVCLIKCRVLNSINFVDEQGMPKDGGIVIMDHKSKFSHPENTNAKEIIHTQNILDAESDISLAEG